MLTQGERTKLLRRKHTLQRYRQIRDYYFEKKTQWVPVTFVWRNYIYPKFFISRQTLYEIFNTNIDKEIAEIDAKLHPKRCEAQNCK